MKIFLVEDEWIVREGIKNNIDWAGHGYEFCGEASDGELAFPQIEKCRPDIVITDIRMPFVDGLELSRLIRKEMPETEIIVLTGHEEFQYAQECIRIGVAQYLLKPVNGGELLAEVGKLAEKIRERRQDEEIRKRYEEEQEERLLAEKKELFRQMVTGGISSGKLWDRAGSLGIDLSAIWYNIVLFHMQSLHHTQEEYSHRIVRLEGWLEKAAEESDVLIFDRGLEGKAFIFKADTEEQLQHRQDEFLSRLEEQLEQAGHIRYFGGKGKAVNRLRELPLSFETASHAFAHRFLMGESRILEGGGLAESLSSDEESFDITTIDPGQVDREKLKTFLKLGDPEEIVFFAEEYFRGVKDAMKSAIFRQYVAMDAYFAVVEFLHGIQVEKEEAEPLDVASGVLQTEESTMQYMVRLLKKAMELRERSASSRYRDVTETVIQYIEDHYADSELSLNEVAAHVNFSPNHLSTIFSQEKGQNFVKYLTDFRMHKAKELLRCSSLRSSEICLEVGYKDPHYFSYLFKKTQGMTPTQYRQTRGNDGTQ